MGPMTQSMQRTLLARDRGKFQDSPQRIQHGVMQPGSIRVTGERHARKFVPPHVTDTIERTAVLTEMTEGWQASRRKKPLENRICSVDAGQPVGRWHVGRIQRATIAGCAGADEISQALRDLRV